MIAQKKENASDNFKVKELNYGYIVVLEKENGEVNLEVYIDLVPILENLSILPQTVLWTINKEKCYNKNIKPI